MKTLKLTLVSVLLVFGLAKYGRAANEAASIANFTAVELGSVSTSSGTARAAESRRIQTNDVGEQRVTAELDEIVISSGQQTSGLWAAGNSTNTFPVAISSFAVTATTWTAPPGCRGLQDNCNVLRIASPGKPVYVKRVYWGPDVTGAGLQVVTPNTSGAGRTTVRLFDSVGSTAVLTQFFFQSQSSNTFADVNHWCSSGTVLMKDSSATITIQLGKQSR